MPAYVPPYARAARTRLCLPMPANARPLAGIQAGDASRRACGSGARRATRAWGLRATSSGLGGRVACSHQLVAVIDAQLGEHVRGFHRHGHRDVEPEAN